MTNKNYVAGRKKEWATVHFYREMQWLAARTAGSHGLIDVIAWHPDGAIHLIQVKRSKRKGGEWKDKNWFELCAKRPGAWYTCKPKVYAFVWRYGSSVPEIFDERGRTEWAA